MAVHIPAFPVVDIVIEPVEGTLVTKLTVFVIVDGVVDCAFAELVEGVLRAVVGIVVVVAALLIARDNTKSNNDDSMNLDCSDHITQSKSEKL